MLNPCSATKEQKEAWSAVDELLHQQIGGSGWDHEDARKKFAVQGYVCLTCYRTVEKCSSLGSLLQTHNIGPCTITILGA